MEEELGNSRQAFDKYRERARTSLKKSAQEQQAAENRHNETQEQLRVCLGEYTLYMLYFRLVCSNKYLFMCDAMNI